MDNQIVIPVKTAELGQFISSLLGKKQIIHKLFSGNFCLDQSNIDHICATIEQRVIKQNNASLVEFNIEVFYNDGASFTLSSLKEFRDHVEIKSVIARGISLNWVYLIQFPGRSIPERQEISLEIRVRSAASSVGFSFLLDDTENGISKKYHTGIILVRISHTERSWGFDIENLLTSILSEAVKSTERSARQFVRKWEAQARPLLAAVGSSIILCLVWLAYSKYMSNIAKRYSDLLRGSPKDMILSKKIDYIIRCINNPEIFEFVLSAIVLFIASSLLTGLLTLFLLEKALSPMPSFLQITPASENHRSIELKRYNHNWATFSDFVIIELIIALLAGALMEFFK